MYRNLFVRSTRTAITATFALGLAVSAHAQAGKPTPEMKYQSAQRNITTAIANLEEYLRENPNGKNAPIARIQLTSLKNLQSSGAAVIPVPFVWMYVNGDLHPGKNDWAIQSIKKESDKTVVTLTIHNTEDGSSNRFPAFEKNPLSLVDNKGQFYNMLAVTSEPPAGVVVDGGKNTWTLQPGQTIQVTVEFDPLAPNATAGKITYKNNERYGATPAEFSLLNKRQAPR